MVKLDDFIRACKSQWVGGGKRYALEDNKEYTDLVCEVVGNQWIGGNIIKYAGEIHNSKRFNEPIPEVDFFKIAVYSFIWWLKEFKCPTTGVELKKLYWPEFADKLYYYADGYSCDYNYMEYIEIVEAILRSTIDMAAKEIYFFELGVMAYYWWFKELGNFTQEDIGDRFEGGSKVVLYNVTENQIMRLRHIAQGNHDNDGYYDYGKEVERMFPKFFSSKKSAVDLKGGGRHG